MNEPELIIGIYFLIVLIVGIYSYFRIKTTNDYYIAGKKGNLFQITGSLFATIVGASALLGTYELSRSAGWPAIWFLICATTGLLMLIPISKRISRLGHYTLPEMLNLFYGKKAEIAASIIIPIAWTGVISAQLVAAAKILNEMGLMDYSSSVWLTGLIFLLYTMIGGQISVIRTDVFQALMIYAGLLIIFFWIIFSSGLQNPNMLIPQKLFNESFTILDLVILFLTYAVTFVVGPDIYSRIFCAKSSRIAARSIFLVALLLIPVGYTMTFLGQYSSGPEFADKPLGLVSLGKNILPGWAFGLFIAALLSAVMSSASTTLITSSTILSSLAYGRLTELKSLTFTRIFIILMGMISIIIALRIQSIMQALLIALSFYSGAFIVPVIAGLLKLKFNPNLVLTAIITGGIVALAGKILQIFYADLQGNIIIIASFILNGIILLIPFNRGSRHSY